MSELRCYRIASLPLAVYREIAAHLTQVKGVTVELVADTNPTFDYLRSQVGYLQLQKSNTDPIAQQRIDQILHYYSRQFGDWEVFS